MIFDFSGFVFRGICRFFDSVSRFFGSIDFLFFGLRFTDFPVACPITRRTQRVSKSTPYIFEMRRISKM